MLSLNRVRSSTSSWFRPPASRPQRRRTAARRARNSETTCTRSNPDRCRIAPCADAAVGCASVASAKPFDLLLRSASVCGRPEILGDRPQHFLRVVPQFGDRHRRSGRNPGLCEQLPLGKDGADVLLDERAEARGRHCVRPVVLAARAGSGYQHSGERLLLRASVVTGRRLVAPPWRRSPVVHPRLTPTRDPSHPDRHDACRFRGP